MKSEIPVVDAALKHMPEHAEAFLVEASGGDFAISIHWKLNSDPDRPNKYSKSIAIIVPRELIEDYKNFPPDLQATVIERFEKQIANRLKSFDPEHDSPRGSPEPAERWIITNDEVIG